MKNIKRVLALVIAMIMIVGTFASVSAKTTEKWYDEAVNYLENKGVAIIRPDAEKKVTRNDFVLWVAKIESCQLDDDAWDEKVDGMTFTDVNETHHYAAIAYSQMMGYIIGNGDGTFAPDKTITLAEACAVIVRLMNYEGKVKDDSADNWKYNYVQVANSYCGVVNSTFLNNTSTYNYDYELNKGEAAYLLATMLNFESKGKNTTSDGRDLGERIENATGGTIGKAYYVSKLNRATYSGADAQVALAKTFFGHTVLTANNFAEEGNGRYVYATTDFEGFAHGRFTGEFDVSSTVELTAVSKTGTNDVITVSGEKFMKMLGLDATKSADQIAVYSKLNVGTLVNAVLSKDTGALKSFTVAENTVTVDTVLLAKSYKVTKDTDVNARFIGWAAATASTTTTDWKPTLPTTYSENLVTSWTNVKKNTTTGAVESAVLNFQGKEYKVTDGVSDDFQIYVLDKDHGYTVDYTDPLTAAEAVKTVINAAQGEVVEVFNDTDNDGTFDTLIVQESYPFEYAIETNTKVANYPKGTTGKYTNSVSEGKVVGEKSFKVYPVGTVLLNKTAVIDNGNLSTNPCTDAYNYTDTPTNSLSLVLVASNAHQADGRGGATYGSYNLPFYTQVDIAAFGVGLIEKIDPVAIDGYWVATIRKTDNTFDTVYIPVEAAETTTLPVTIGGATADYTFDSSAWLTFLNEDVANGCIDEGIVKVAEDISNPTYKAQVGAWMVGHYVQYATDKSGKAICLLSTDTKTATTGFVTAVNTTASDNIYNVTVAVTGAGKNTEGGNYYLSAVTDANVAAWTSTITYSDANIGSDTYQHLKSVTFEYGGTNITAVIVQDLPSIGYTTASYDYAYARDIATDDLYKLTNWIAYIDGEGEFVVTKDDATKQKYAHAVTEGTEHYYGSYKAANTAYHAIQTTGKTNGKGVTAQAVCGWYGNDLFDYVNNRKVYGVASVKSFDVRASVSSMFDWDNYKVYNTLFKQGSLIDPNAGADGKVNPGKDLIYVTVMEDANSNYILYGDKTAYAEQDIKTTCAGSMRMGNSSTGANAFANGWWWYPTFTGEVSPQDNWTDVDGAYVIDSTVIANTKELVYSDWGDVIGETNRYDRTVGYGPYYDRTYNSATGKYSYVLKFTTVKEYTNVLGTSYYDFDEKNSEIYIVRDAESGEQIVDYKYSYQYTKAIEADGGIYHKDGYFVNDAGAVYAVFKAQYDSTKVTKVVYAEDANTSVINTWTAAAGDAEVLFKNASNPKRAISKYATLTVKEAPITTQGYYPGMVVVTLDGTDYIADEAYSVVLVTPSATGFDITNTTFGDLPDNGLFVTTWNAAVTDGVITSIAVVGEAAEVGTDDDVPASSQGITLKNGEQIVYLSKNAKAVVNSGLNKTDWRVESSESAYALLTGKDIGSIYRSYSTYEEAVAVAEQYVIDLEIVGGHWYRVDANGEIIEDLTEGGKLSGVESAVITSATVDGKTTANIDGKKGVDVSKYQFEFYYKNADESALVKASDSTTANVTTAEAYANAYSAKQKAYDEAKKAYDDAVAKGVATAEALQTKQDAMDAAYAELIATKTAFIEKNFNGQFWNTANSPYYRYVVLGRNFQQEVSTLTFNYIKVNGIYCVFSDEFAF